jgi:spermidine synthase
MNKKTYLTIITLFFLSGLCALVYEVVWLRLLGLVFGNTTFAISTVLAAYMAGLGIGSLYFGKKIDNQGNPLLLYSFLEIGIGVFCLFTPIFWKIIEFLYVNIYQLINPGFFAFSLIRFALAFTLLFIPTFFMGGTLPILSKFLVGRSHNFSKDIGLLYGINTLGACAGVLFSSFLLINWLGVNLTIFLTAFSNIAIGLLAYRLFYKESKNPSADIVQTKEHKISPDEPITKLRFKSRTTLWIVLIGFGISGYTSMAYEIGWTKVLSIALGSTVYSFAIMLSTFLVGMAIGSMLVSKFAKQIKINLHLFALIEIGIAFSVLIGMGFLDKMPFLFLSFFKITQNHHILFRLVQFFLAGSIMLVPTFLFGATFPVVTNIVSRFSKGVGESIGLAYFINTIGTVLGSTLTGFCFIPWIGIQNSMMLAILLNLIVGIALIIAARKSFLNKHSFRVALPVLIVAIMIPFHQSWSKSALTSDIAINPAKYVPFTQKQIQNTLDERERLFYKEGLDATVSVVRKDEKFNYLLINGKVDASAGDMFTQLFLGHIPMLLNNHPVEKVLNIGMGSGVTVAALASYPVKNIHCVELEEGVVEAARFFKKENRNVLKDPRLTVFTNDARNHLLVHDDKYDVIVSEPSNPWVAGEASLFTKEQFTLMKDHLSDDGIACQWLHLYAMSPDDLKMIIKTYSEVFEHVTLWYSNINDFMLIGSRKPQYFSTRLINQKIAAYPHVKKDLALFDIFDASGILSNFMLSTKDIQSFVADAKINTDNFPHLEYSAPKSLYKQTLKENMQALAQFKKNRYPILTKHSFQLLQTAHLHNAIAQAYLKKELLFSAKSEVSIAHQIDKNDPETIYTSGLLDLKTGNIDQAIKKIGLYLKDFPADSRAHFHLGFAYEQKNDMEQATKEYLASINLDKSTTEHLLSLGRILMKAKRYKQAMNILAMALKREGPRSEALPLLAQSYFLSGNVESALKFAHAFLDLNPRSVRAHRMLIYYTLASGEKESALDLCKEMNKIYPKHPDVYFLFNKIYSAMGKTKRSEKMLAIARKLER